MIRIVLLRGVLLKQADRADYQQQFFTQTKRRPFQVALERIVSGLLDSLHVLGLPPFRAFDHVE